MHRISLSLALIFALSVGRSAAGFDYDRKVSEATFDCGNIFEHGCGIESPDNISIARDSVAVVWTGDYNVENGLLYADRSANGGRTWGTDVTNIDQQRSITPRAIVASPDNPASVIIAWVTYDTPGISLFLDVSYDWMRTFTYSRKDLRVARGVANTSAADVAIGSGDTLVAVFARGDTIWATFSTLDDPSVWGSSLALLTSENPIDQVDVEAGSNGEYGAVWREKISGRGVIRSLTFSSADASMPVKPLRADYVASRRWPINVIERPALNTTTVSDDPSLDYARPTIRSFPSEGGSPGAWWVAFQETQGRVLLDRRTATPTGEWGADILLNAPNVDLPALAVAQEGGIEFVIAAYRQWGEITLFDLGEFDGAAFTWKARESVSAGHGADRVNGHGVVVLGLNPLRFGVTYTPINHDGIGTVWFKGFTYDP